MRRFEAARLQQQHLSNSGIGQTMPRHRAAFPRFGPSKVRSSYWQVSAQSLNSTTMLCPSRYDVYTLRVPSDHVLSGPYVLHGGVRSDDCLCRWLFIMAAVTAITWLNMFRYLR